MAAIAPQWCWPSRTQSCSTSFRRVGSVAEVRASLGDTYHWSAADGVLTIRVVQPPPNDVGRPEWRVPVDAEALMPLSIILIGTLFAVYLVALVSGFRLTKCVGLIFFSFYFIFVAYDLLHEFDKIPF